VRTAQSLVRHGLGAPAEDGDAAEAAPGAAARRARARKRPTPG